jgi:hypothetical protein
MEYTEAYPGAANTTSLSYQGHQRPYQPHQRQTRWFSKARISKPARLSRLVGGCGPHTQGVLRFNLVPPPWTSGIGFGVQAQQTAATLPVERLAGPEWTVVAFSVRASISTTSRGRSR